MNWTYETKPEHTEQIVFCRFGKHEQINKLPATVRQKLTQ